VGERGEGCALIVKRWATGLVFALCFLVPVGAWASQSQVTVPPPPGENQWLGPSGFERTINALQNSGNEVAKHALKIGNQLLWMLLVIAIAWFGIQVMLGVEGGSFESAVGEFVSRIFIWGLIAWLMKDYSQLTNAIVNGFSWLGAYLTVGNASASKVAQTAGYFLPGIHLIHMGMVTFEAVKNLPWTTGSIWNLSFSTHFLVSIVTMVFILAMSGGMFIAAFLYIGIAMLSMLLVSVAIAIGPIFIPFFVLEFTSFLFNGWFRFLLMAALYRLVGGVIIAIIEQFIKSAALQGGATSLIYQVGTNPPAYSVSLFAAAGDILVVAVLVYLVLEIPKISSQIANGAPNISMREMGGFAKGFRRKEGGE
jgi:hypothetical protein